MLALCYAGAAAAGERSPVIAKPIAGEVVPPPADAAAFPPFEPLLGEPVELPPVDPTPPAPELEYDADAMLDGPIVTITPDDPHSYNGAAGRELADFAPLAYDPLIGRIAWLPGDDDRFGIVSLENVAALSTDARSGVVTGFGVHFLDGPLRTEMPPRLFDFVVGYQRREWIRPNFGWDFVFRVGAFSDFEGSAKQGVRFPSHVVTMLRLSPALTWLLGIDYVDRDDFSLLPVFGAVWTPADDLRFDLAFPRPRAAMRIMDSPSWIYAAGELGGGTWAVERDQLNDDNVTYRDLRLIFGIETLGGRGSSALELGYVFDRQLEYRSAIGDYSPRECLMIALVSRY